MAKIKDLIQQAGGTAHESVAAAKNRYLDQVRGVLRDLTRLKFTDRQGVESQHTSVPIRVVTGLPEPLKDIGEEVLPSGEQLGIETIGMWWQHIQLLDAVSLQLRRLVKVLRDTPGWLERAEMYDRRLDETVSLAQELADYAAKAELLKRLTKINKDILGVYMPTVRLIPDRGQIEIYWVVLGAVARLVGVDAEALAVVVMAHELAHAYTHVGLDSNKNCWEDGFWDCDPGIVEGLAQYYTHLAAAALKEERGYDRIWAAYEELTNLQMRNGATVYVNHLEWMDKISPEAMRQCLLDLRRGYINRKFEPFCEALDSFAKRYPMKTGRAHA